MGVSGIFGGSPFGQALGGLGGALGGGFAQGMQQQRMLQGMQQGMQPSLLLQEQMLGQQQAPSFGLRGPFGQYGPVPTVEIRITPEPSVTRSRGVFFVIW